MYGLLNFIAYKEIKRFKIDNKFPFPLINRPCREFSSKNY